MRLKIEQNWPRFPTRLATIAKARQAPGKFIAPCFLVVHARAHAAPASLRTPFGVHTGSAPAHRQTAHTQHAKQRSQQQHGPLTQRRDGGDIVSLYARMVRVGRTSMTVNFEAYTERIRNQGATSRSPKPS